MRWITGDGFVPLDDRAAAPQVVVNQAFVDRYLPDGAVDRPAARAGRPPLRHRRRGGDRAVRRLRRAADAGDVLLLSRPPGTHRRAARAHPSGRRSRRSAARCGAAISGLDPAAPVFNVAHARRARREQPAAQAHSGAPVPGARPAAAGAGRQRHPRGGRLRGVGRGAPRSACGWRSARPAGASSASWSPPAWAWWRLAPLPGGWWCGSSTRGVVGGATDLRAFVLCRCCCCRVAALSSWLPARGAPRQSIR